MTYEERLQLFRTNVGFALPNDVERKLDELGFFNAPASTKYHLSYEGGLFEHSMNVAMSLLDISCKLKLNWQRPISPFVIGIFHDLCKCDLYKKQADGTYAYNVDADSRHGIKSLEIARKIMDITDEEAACIEHHMGAFTEKDKWKAYSSAVQKYENVYGLIQLICILRRYSRVNLVISDELSFPIYKICIQTKGGKP